MVKIDEFKPSLKWPKQLLELTDEQLRIKDDFMKHWHEVLPKKYGIIERFNHGYPATKSIRSGKTLEIGCGLGEHIQYEHMEQNDYYALELRPEMAERIHQRYPAVTVVVGDCQKGLDFPDGFFDRILAIHVLEHLPDLPTALHEVHRLLKIDGEFCVVIPCEGGLAYSLARRISAKRIFERRYKYSYDWFIKTEHINLPNEIFEEVKHHFNVRSIQYFPFRIPSTTFNLVIGMILNPKKDPESKTNFY